MEFAETWQEARTQWPVPSLFFVPIKKNKMAARPLIGWDSINYSSGAIEWSLIKLDQMEALHCLYYVVVRVYRQTKMATQAYD